MYFTSSNATLGVSVNGSNLLFQYGWNTQRATMPGTRATMKIVISSSGAVQFYVNDSLAWSPGAISVSNQFTHHFGGGGADPGGVDNITVTAQ